jgi:hypothetical protein
MDKKFKFKIIDEDSREVFLDGVKVGVLHKIWHRLGGQGWSDLLDGKGYPYKTLKDAAWNMMRRKNGK